MLASLWASKKDAAEAPKERASDDGLVQQLIDKLRADGGDKAGEQLVAGEREAQSRGLGGVGAPREPHARARTRCAQSPRVAPRARPTPTRTRLTRLGIGKLARIRARARHPKSLGERQMRAAPPRPPLGSVSAAANRPPPPPPNPQKKPTTGGELAHASEVYDRATLRRWLVAREWDVAAAHKSIVEHASWRQYQVPGGRVREARVAGPLSDNKVFLQGVDAQGRAVLVIQARRHRPIAAASASTPPPPMPADPDAPLDPLRAQRAFVVYVLDAALALCDPARNPGRRLISVFDLTGASYANLDAGCMRYVIGCLNAHSVERMQTLYFYNPPAVFFGLWKALAPLLPPATKDKIRLIDAKQRGELLAAVGEEVLPAEYGGKAELVPVQEAVARFGLPPASGTLGEAVAAASARLGGKGGERRPSVELAVEAHAAEAEAVAVMA